MSPFSQLNRPAVPAATICCFPFAGGSSGIFRDLRVPPDVLLLGVDLPGRATRFGEPPLTAMDEVLTELLAHSHALRPPFLLFGHSLGAIIAFELTRALERGGRGPRHLVVSGRRAPHLASPHPRISHLPDPELVRELKKYRGTPEAVLAEPDLLDLVLPMLRADFAISETYRFDGGPGIRADLTILGATDDDVVDVATLDEWARHSSGACDVRTFSGGHFFIRDMGLGEVLSQLAQISEEEGY